MQAGQEPALFWHLTPREICAVMEGAAERYRREYNDTARAAWMTARLTAYAPEKSAAFPKLDKMLLRKPKSEAAAKRGWEKDFAVMSSWAARSGAAKRS